MAFKPKLFLRWAVVEGYLKLAPFPKSDSEGYVGGGLGRNGDVHGNTQHR